MFFSGIVLDEASHDISRGSLESNIDFCIQVDVFIGRVSLKVSRVPDGEFIFVHLTKEVVQIASCIVGPGFSYVKVLNKLAWISSPKLFGWDESTWWNHRACSKLGTTLDLSSFQNDTFVTNDDIVSNLA